MEKKKLLLVAISVGLFLVITIVAAILIFTPKNTSAPAAAASGSPVPAAGTDITIAPPAAAQQALGTQNTMIASVDAVDMLRNNGDVPGLASAPEGTFSQNGNYYVNGSGQPSSNNGTVISVPKPSTAAVPDSAPAGRAVSAPAERTTTATTATTTAAAAPQTSVTRTTPRPAAQSQTQTQAQSKPAVQTRVHDDFWVQTGAFSTLSRAEGVKQTLAAKGITSIIENRDVEGRTLFRVRVGPYTSQNEANYWLSLIKSIGGFEDSQVRQTRR